MGYKLKSAYRRTAEVLKVRIEDGAGKSLYSARINKDDTSRLALLLEYLQQGAGFRIWEAVDIFLRNSKDVEKDIWELK